MGRNAENLPMRFVRSYVRLGDLPKAEAEVALVGRSNVGKSSLLNALAQRKALAKTSKSPGATRLLNAYEVGPSDSKRYLMDLPGYGYAKVSKQEKERWAKMINEYLEGRLNLKAVLMLIDAANGPTALDLQTHQWLGSLGRQICFVATKIDKIASGKVAKRRSEITQKLGVESSAFSWTSAKSGAGVAELRTRLEALLEPNSA